MRRRTPEVLPTFPEVRPSGTGTLTATGTVARDPDPDRGLCACCGRAPAVVCESCLDERLAEVREKALDDLLKTEEEVFADFQESDEEEDQ